MKCNLFFLPLQVLILEPTKVYQPSYLSINKDVDDNTVSIWHVAPDDKVPSCFYYSNLCFLQLCSRDGVHILYRTHEPNTYLI